jgi:plastocyanin
MGKFIVGLFVVAAGAAAGWYYFGGGFGSVTPKNMMPRITGGTGGSAPVPDVTITDESEYQGTTKGGIVAELAVTYTDSGYSPKTITVKKGTAVTFTNNSSMGMWTASAVHPTHQVLPGFDAKKSVSKGGTYTYTFEKVGTWQYHNHVKATDTGTVIVTE